MADIGQLDIFATLLPLLQRKGEDDGRPIVLMTCGLAGSGKSTLAKTVTAKLPQFTRLSIDEIVFTKHGLYGVDYPADLDLYQKYLEEADQAFLSDFHNLLQNGKDVVLDRSFYALEDREEYRKMIVDKGGRPVLVYLSALDKEALWRRICERGAKKKEANSSLDITRDIFDMYWEGFEHPTQEGEIVVRVT